MIERYSPSGTRVEAVAGKVASKATAEVRLDFSSAGPLELGWIRVVEKSRSVVVSCTYECLKGNTLTTVPYMLPTFRRPVSDKAIQSARKFSIRHRYTLDSRALPGGALYCFVNLSAYPVQVGMCQENYPDCTNPALTNKIAPMASISFPLDPTKRFAVLESTPGYSAGAALKWTDGLAKIFGSSSSIVFDSVR